MDDLLRRLDDKKSLLKWANLPKEQLDNLRDWYKVEMTYTSNALEGNTLSRQQTALIVEKNITVAGKSITEHLEAVGHAQAFDHIWQLAKNTQARDIDSRLILDIHRLVLGKLDDVNAGRLRNVPVRVAGSRVVFPNPRRVSDMLNDLVEDIQRSDKHICLAASLAHLGLVSIHPFVDGNGRTARLLMNLMLLQAGWPPAIIRKQDRLRYLLLLEDSHAKKQTESFHIFIMKAIERALNEHLKPQSPPPNEEELFKIGTLALASRESVATLRYWTSQGLLFPTEITTTKYRLYDPLDVKRIKLIRQLQNQRLTLAEIKEKLDQQV